MKKNKKIFGLRYLEKPKHSEMGSGKKVSDKSKLGIIIPTFPHPTWGVVIILTDATDTDHPG